jgi:hypothetical protein
MASTQLAVSRWTDAPAFALPSIVRRRLSPVPPRSVRIVAAAVGRLRAAGYQGLAEVTCDFHEGVLTLRGRVPTYYMKQVAQTAVRALEEVTEIVNRIEVFAPPD